MMLMRSKEMNGWKIVSCSMCWVISSLNGSNIIRRENSASRGSSGLRYVESNVRIKELYSERDSNESLV